jgi:hypothetical protein
MTYVYAFCFSCLVQMIFRNVVCGDIALINTITQFHSAFCTLELYCSFYLFFLLLLFFLWNMALKFLVQGVLFICCVSSLVGSWQQFMFPIVVWDRHPLCLVCQVPDQWNSELLLWYFWSTNVLKVEGQLHRPLPGLTANGTSVHLAVRPVHITHVPFSLGL